MPEPPEARKAYEGMEVTEGPYRDGDLPDYSSRSPEPA
jgi:hypothetical protein